MKKILIIISIVFLTLISCKNTSKDENSPETVELKEHTCSEACFNAGECVFVHGEKNHICTVACKANSTALKVHKCTDDCHKNEGCVFVHGEKGHTCDKNCKA